MSPTSSTVSRRDAAVAAALAGTVVVVLGYASGLGVRVEPATTTVTPAPPAAPVTPAPEPEPTMEMVPAPVMSPMPVATPAHPVPETPVAPDHPIHPTPTEPEPDPDPVPEPSPDPGVPDGDAASCTSLLAGLPVVGPATVPLTSLLGDVLVTTPVALGLATPPSSDESTPLGCVLGGGAS